MTAPNFPVLAKSQDSKYFTVEMEDVALKTKMDGGYVVSRAKHTRKPRKTFKAGYTGISNADKLILQNFYESVGGGSVIFNWVSPIKLVTSVMQQNGSQITVTSTDSYAVRFVEKMIFQYAGIGNTQMWDVQFSIEQA